MAADEHSPEKLLIFQDIFRRANKKDDGAVSWEEFVSYFEDGVTNVDELRTLFDDIDTHNTDNIDTGEMCSYFYHHLGSFRQVFQKLEEINVLVSESLSNVAKDYKHKSWKDKFVDRFLMREITTQLSALGRPIEAATDSLEDNIRLEMSDKMAVSEARPLFTRSISGVVPGRYGRRARRCLPSIQSPDSLTGSTESGSLAAQVDKLSSLVHRLEAKVNEDSLIDLNSSHTVSLSRLEYRTPEDVDTERFKLALLKYIAASNSFDGCIKIDARLNGDSAVVHSVWLSEKCRYRFSETDSTVDFSNECSELGVELTEAPSMPVPAEWWKPRREV